MMRTTHEELRLILVDPKRVELGQYNGLPHLLTQVVVDPKKAASALSWAVTEMERRYDLLAEVGMRDITGYNLAIDRGEIGSTPAVAHATDGSPHEVGEAADDGEIEGEEEESLEIGVEDEESLEAVSVADRIAEVREAVEPEPSRHTRLPFILVVVD